MIRKNLENTALHVGLEARGDASKNENIMLKTPKDYSEVFTLLHFK